MGNSYSVAKSSVFFSYIVAFRLMGLFLPSFMKFPLMIMGLIIEAFFLEILNFSDWAKIEFIDYVSKIPSKLRFSMRLYELLNLEKSVVYEALNYLCTLAEGSMSKTEFEILVYNMDEVLLKSNFLLANNSALILLFTEFLSLIIWFMLVYGLCRYMKKTGVFKRIPFI